MGRYNFDSLHGNTEAVHAIFLLQSTGLVFTEGYESVVRMWDMDDGFLISASRPLGCTIRAIAADADSSWWQGPTCSFTAGGLPRAVHDGSTLRDLSILPTLALIDALERYTQISSHPPHKTNKPGILSADIHPSKCF